jgi:hypothetical protein
VPAYSNIDVEFEDGRLMDKNGNTNVVKSIEYLNKLREPVFFNAKSQREIDLYVCESPITISEACIISAGNIFPQRLLQEQLARIRNNKDISAMKQVGDLVFTADGMKWMPKPFGDILNYPLANTDDPRGAIVI